MNKYTWISLTKLCAVALLMVCAGGCASIIKGTTQKIPIASEPPGAEVLVDGRLVGQTPLNVKMKRKNDHLVTIQKTQYRPQSVAVVKDVGGAVWGNIIAGGLIGWGVDATTGAQYNLTPKTIAVTLDRAGASGESGESAGGDKASLLVSRLSSLDEMKENKQISDEEYGKARIELFQKYMPEALPEEVRNPKPPTEAAPSQEPSPPVDATPQEEAAPPQ